MQLGNLSSLRLCFSLTASAGDWERRLIAQPSGFGSVPFTQTCNQPGQQCGRIETWRIVQGVGQAISGQTNNIQQMDPIVGLGAVCANGLQLEVGGALRVLPCLSGLNAACTKASIDYTWLADHAHGHGIVHPNTKQWASRSPCCNTARALRGARHLSNPCNGCCRLFAGQGATTLTRLLQQGGRILDYTQGELSKGSGLISLLLSHGHADDGWLCL